MPSIFERWRMTKPSVINVTVSGDASTQVLNLSALDIYQSQDNVRSVVSFLADSIAQLPLKVYVRNGENDRERDRDSTAAKTLWRPNDYMTAFEFMQGLMSEFFVFGSVYVWIADDVNTESGYSLHIIPMQWVVRRNEATKDAPASLRVSPINYTIAVDIPMTELCQFKTYSPGNPKGYLSPLASLRQTLEEQVEAGRFRRQLWKSSGRLNAQITRPKDVAPWTKEQKLEFAQLFREAWGAGGSKAGSIPIMEDGMEIKPFSTSFKESEWAQSVKLSRESVAAVYHVNPSLIWHSDTQTYASSKDNARALYAECLGPVIQMLQQRINAFLLPMLDADSKTYVELDLEEKLKGSFEDQASILQTATGRPWMTVDEARARMNLPKLPDGQGEGLVVPLNVEVSGQANPGNDYAYPGEDNNSKKLVSCECKACKEVEELRIKGRSDKEDDEKVQRVLTDFFKRQSRSIIPKIMAGAEDFWNAERWDKELAEDLEPVLIEISDKHGKDTSKVLGSEYSTEVTRNYLAVASEARAKKINEGTLRQINKELERDFEDGEEPDIGHVYEVRENTAGTLARSAAGAIASFATQEAAHQAISDGAPRVIGRVVEKEWITGANARPSHQAMNGERVPLDADFSNGQHWPGEDIGDPEESCGCNCTTEVVISGG